MASLTETLRLFVDFDSKKAVSEVERLGDKSEKAYKKSQSALDKWGSGLSKGGAAMVGFGAAALFGLGKMAQASEDADRSTLKLQNSLKANPRLAGENVKTYTDLAQAIQSKTAADGDDVVAGIAVLAQGKLNASQMKTLIPLVVDLARKKGMDETAAFQLASKAAGGNALALKKQGIAVDENLAKTDAYKATVDALRSSVGGYAEQEGKTFSGSMERLKNQLGDLEEGVGKGAVEAFTEMASAASFVTDRLNSLSPGVEAGIGKWATYGAATLTAVGGLSFLTGQIITARQRFGTLASAVKDNSDILVALGRGAANAALNLGVLYEAAHVVDDLFKEAPADANKLENSLLRLGQTGKATGELTGKFGKNLGDLKEAVNQVIKPGLSDEILHVSDSLVSLGGAIPLGSGNLDTMRKRIDEVDKALSKLAARSPKAAADALSALERELGLSGSEAKRFERSLNNYQSTLADVDTSKATSGVKDLGGAMSETGDSTKEADDALKTYVDDLRAEFDPLFAMQDALLDQAKAQQQLTDATHEQTKATDDYNKAVAKHGENSKAARAAAVARAEADRKVQEATLAASKTTIDFSAATKTLKEKLDTGSISLAHARQQMYNLAVAAGFPKDQALRMAAAFNVASGAAKRVPKSVTTTVKAFNWVQAREQLDAVTHAANRIPRSIPIRVQVFTSGTQDLQTLAHGGPVRAHASGGPLSPGWHLVGDDGPELMYLGAGSSGQVYNKDQIRSIGGGGHGGSGGGFGRPVNLTVNVNAGAVLAGEQQIVRVIKDALQRGAFRGFL